MLLLLLSLLYLVRRIRRGRKGTYLKQKLVRKRGAVSAVLMAD